MDRRGHLSNRSNKMAAGLNETARNLDRAMSRAGVNHSDKEAFLDWMMKKSWEKFKDERMSARIAIENQIKQLHLQLPNGTVNREYIATFDLPNDIISDIRLEGISELGLVFTEEEKGKFSLRGVPVVSGDFRLKLRFNTVKGEPYSEIILPLAFNPDPKTLWKDIPTDPDIRYYKLDNTFQVIKPGNVSGTESRKEIVAASRRGRSHAQEGKARDDHFGIYHCDQTDWYIISAADGAGSAPYSRKGSEIACETVVAHCKKLLGENATFEASIREYESDRENKEKRTNLTRQVIDIIYNGALKAYQSIKDFAEQEGDVRIKDFATTLMFAICKKFDFGWFIATFWVGDGAMCLLDTENKTAKLLGVPDEGEFSGQTRFITMQEIFRDPEIVAKRLRMAIVKDFTALFLMTDGVSDPMFETENNLNAYSKWGEFYDKLQNGFPEDGIKGVDFNSENVGKEVLEWLNFWSPGNHDDRTLVILQ